MSVDKFGHYSGDLKPLKGPRGEGFALTEEGDYDVKRKRVRYLKDPIDRCDAVNLETLEKGLGRSLSLGKGPDMWYNAAGKAIRNVAYPLIADDVATKGYVDSKTPDRVLHENSYSFKGYRLKKLGNPVDGEDAVTLDYLKQNSLHGDKYFDSGDKLISNVGSPINDKDAINKKYLKSRIPLLKSEQWDFKHRRLSNVTQPVEDDDVVTKAYLNARVPKNDSNSWDFEKKRIIRLQDPTGFDNAVNVNYLVRVLSLILFDFYNKIGVSWKAVPVSERDVWIKNNIVDPYFVNHTLMAKNGLA